MHGFHAAHGLVGIGSATPWLCAAALVQLGLWDVDGVELRWPLTNKSPLMM